MFFIIGKAFMCVSLWNLSSNNLNPRLNYAPPNFTLLLLRYSELLFLLVLLGIIGA